MKPEMIAVGQSLSMRVAAIGVAYEAFVSAELGTLSPREKRMVREAYDSDRAWLDACADVRAYRRVTQ